MKKRIIAGLIIAATLILSMPVNAQAAGKWEKAENAYKKFLKKYQSTYVVPNDWGAEDNTENYKYCSSYAIKDMNNDGVPELLTSHVTNLKKAISIFLRIKTEKYKRLKMVKFL